jgi:hypothetical protein
MRSRTGSRPARCSPRCLVLHAGSWRLRFTRRRAEAAWVPSWLVNGSRCSTVLPRPRSPSLGFRSFSRSMRTSRKQRPLPRFASTGTTDGPAQRNSPRCLDSRRCIELETSSANRSSRPAARRPHLTTWRLPTPHCWDDEPRRWARFDSIWATAEFTLDSFESFYADALAAGSDHALLRATTTLE